MVPAVMMVCRVDRMFIRHPWRLRTRSGLESLSGRPDGDLHILAAMGFSKATL